MPSIPECCIHRMLVFPPRKQLPLSAVLKAPFKSKDAVEELNQEHCTAEIKLVGGRWSQDGAQGSLSHTGLFLTWSEP